MAISARVCVCWSEGVSRPQKIMLNKKIIDIMLEENEFTHRHINIFVRACVCLCV